MRLVQLLFFLFVTHINAQSGTFLYEMKNKKLSDSTYSSNIYTLDVQDGVSVFRTLNEKKSDSLKNLNKFGFGPSLNIEAQIYLVKNSKDKVVYKSIQPESKVYYDVIIDEELIWKILPETSTIAQMKVQKATTNYGGRTWTAWFAPDIQIQDGPYVFSGLPGLILKINDDFNDYIFDIQEIKQNEEPLHYRKMGLKMNFPTFKKFMMNYYMEPYAEKRIKNEPIFKATDSGEIVRDNYNDATKYLQKIIKENNNPIELNYKNNYK